MGGDSRVGRTANSQERRRGDSRTRRRGDSREDRRADSRHRRRASSREGRRANSLEPRRREHTPERRKYERPRSRERRYRSRSPPRHRRGRGSRGNERTYESPKLFIGNISYDTDERLLEDLFCKFGRLTDVYIPRPPSRYGKARDKKFGFVTYERTEDARAARREWDQRELNGNRLSVEYSRKRPRRPHPTRYRSRSRSRNRSYY